jgi:PKD repeat protein
MVRVALVLIVIAAALSAVTGCSVGAPDAEFTSSVTTGTVPLTVKFTDRSTGDAKAWAWDFDGDMQIDTSTRNPEYTYYTPGTYTVTLRASGPGGASLETKQGYITVLPPADTIASITPDSGRLGDTLNVVVVGESFTQASTLNLGAGIAVNSVTVQSSTQLTANITIYASAQPGPRDVTVTLSAGSAAFPAGFLVTVPQAPVITAVSPTSADLAAKVDLAITGSNLDLVTGVDLGEGITVESLTSDSSTHLTASITIADTAPATLRTVSVTNPGGTATLQEAFQVTVPESPLVTGVSPRYGSRGQTVEVEIDGDSFWGASAVEFRSGTGVEVNSFTIDSKTQITARVSISDTAILGPRDISVTTPGGTATLTAGFEVVGLSPSWGNRGQALTVVITGKNLTGTTALSFGDGISVSSFTVDSPTQITAVIAIARTAIPGSREVTATAPGGITSAIGGFTIASPVCTADFVANRTTGSGTTTVKFTDKSTGEITGWAWDLNGDGKIDSTAQNPSFTYSKNGSFTVTLTVSGDYCRDTLTKTAYIKISGCST